MNATTIVIAITVADNRHSRYIGERIAGLLDAHWDTLPNRLAQDIRVHRHDEKAIGDMLNKAALGEEPS